MRSGSGSKSVSVCRLVVLSALSLGCGMSKQSVNITTTVSLKASPKAAAAQEAFTTNPEELESARKNLTARVCESPSVDAYAHVDMKCLGSSPTATWWRKYLANGGKQEDLIAHIEEAAEHDGVAVKWGLGNKMETAEDCARACLNHKITGENLPCNTFTWCQDEICYEPDAHKHTKGDCWLKFTEGPAYPEVNLRGEFPKDFRARNPKAPKRLQWWGGVLLPAGIEPTNGTWSPRHSWFTKG